MGDKITRKRIEAEYAAFLRGAKAYSYNGMFVRQLMSDGKVIPDREKWANELSSVAADEHDKMIESYGVNYKSRKESGRNYLTEDIMERDLNNCKWDAILRDYFQGLKLKGVKRIYKLEELD